MDAVHTCIICDKTIHPPCGTMASPLTYDLFWQKRMQHYPVEQSAVIIAASFEIASWKWYMAFFSSPAPSFVMYTCNTLCN